MGLSKTVVEEMYDMLDSNKITELAELKEWYLQIEEAQHKYQYERGMVNGMKRCITIFEDKTNEIN